MFFAALTSRSCRVPQDGHCHVRVFKLRLARTCPHAEHVLDDGYHRSITIRCRPYLAALYSSMARKAPRPQSEIALARTQPNVRFNMLACAWSGYTRHLHAVFTNGNLIRLNPDT